jgi:urease accessory protein
MMRSQHARLELALMAGAERTRPARALATPPLQLSRARYDNPAEPTELYLTLTHLGGVLAGDRYHIDIAMGPAAQAVLLPAAATQIYTMPTGTAEQHSQLRTAPNAQLYWQTAPQILFSGANYRQSMRIALAPGARVLLSDILVAGRLAHGEAWQCAHYSSRTEIYDLDGQLLAGDRIVLEPQRRSPVRCGVMGRYTILGTLWLLGDTFDAEHIARRISTEDRPISAAVLPANCGLVIRLLGWQLTATQQAIHAIALTYARGTPD